MRGFSLSLFARRVLVALAVVAFAFPPQAHAFTVDGTVSITFNANDRRTVGINSSANLAVNFQPAIAFTNGSGADQVGVLYQGKLSLSSGTLNVDLNGVLTDSYGSTVSLVRVKAIAFQNNSASNGMTVGNGTNPWATLLGTTSTLTIPAGAWFVFATPDATGWAVTASTGDILKVAGTGTDQFTVIVMGSAT